MNSEIKIHSTAVVDSKAEIGRGVDIGPYSIIGPNVRIGSGTIIKSHTVVDGCTEIGEENVVGPFASLGAPPQDLKYKGEPTKLIIGNRNIIREYATMHVGTPTGRSETRVGDECMFLVGVHIAHDCVIGNKVVIANATHLGGHVEIEDRAVLGALIGIHQHVRVGRLAMLSAKSGVPMDIPPFTLAAMDRAKLFGLNHVGLDRAGISKERQADLKKAFRIIFKSSLKLKDAIERVRSGVAPSEEINHLLRFLETSARGITR